MEEKKFNLINRILSIVVLVGASIVYLSTIEPTASFWDCGEFIASSYKLEVGHPPGNPVFQLFSRFFTIFTDSAHAAMAVNSVSALCSAFTIFFLFLTIVHFGRRIIECSGKAMTKGNAVAVFGAGVVGAMAYCFSDTFWFSAVEGEVYAMSSLFTAIVFWAILKWEEEFGSPYANRWIVLICFLMGLSIGVHLLNLLVIPAIVFVYYYKTHSEKVTLCRAFIVLCVSGAIVALVLFGIIPFLPKAAGFVDRIFVNTFKAPFNVGTLVFMVALFVACFLLMNFFRKGGKAIAHTITLCFTVIAIGYTTFAIVMVRAAANPPTNEHSPDNPYNLVRYLAREQYGSTPILYGQAYTSAYDVARDETYYARLDDKYIKVYAPAYADYPAGTKMFFPRMWSTQSDAHKNFYDVYTQGKFKTNKVEVRGQTLINKMPTFGANMRFFFDYQLNYMYFRYFMWNFVGRQNDLHGQTPGDLAKGNWESGIKFIDRLRLGDQETGPAYIVDSVGKNHYFFLPLILGLIGFFFQLKKDGRNAWINTLLFLLTGVAIIVYLNQPPYQVRERDYAYAGSFYVFAIWIGLGVMWVKEQIDKLLAKNEKGEVASAAAASLICFLAVPLIMGCQNWDDHDRSGRYTAPELAYNYLNSCGDNAILVTHGDNDTFPLWYAQEVESVRTDVRIFNSSLAGMDWYIDQMKCRSNNSAPLPITLPRRDYLYGTNDAVSVIDAFGRPLYVHEVMEIFKDPKYRKDGEGVIAAKTIRIPVNKENALASGIVAPEDADRMLDYIEVTIPGSMIMKFDLIMLDLLDNYQWDRPICSITTTADCSFSLDKYLQNEGFAYKLVPYQVVDEEGLQYVDAESLYNRLMNVYKFDACADTHHCVDYQNLYSLTTVMPVRLVFITALEQLVYDGKMEKAVALFDKCIASVPHANYPYNLSEFQGSNEYCTLKLIEIGLAIGRKDKALEITDIFTKETLEAITYYAQPNALIPDQMMDERMLRTNLGYLQRLKQLLSTYGYQEKADWIDSCVDQI